MLASLLIVTSAVNRRDTTAPLDARQCVYVHSVQQVARRTLAHLLTKRRTRADDYLHNSPHYWRCQFDTEWALPRSRRTTVYSGHFRFPAFVDRGHA